MLLSERERYVLECQITSTTTPDKAPPIYLNKYIHHLKRLAENGDALYKMSNGRVAIRLVKVKIFEDVSVLLFQYTNKDLSNPSFSEIQTGKTRVAKKKNGEGISVSAHLCINNKPSNETLPEVNTALLEEVHGLSKINVNAALSSFIKKSTNFSYTDPETKKEHKCNPRARIDYNANQNLKTLLSKGSITGFQAVKSSSVPSLDEKGQIQVEEETLKLRVARTTGDEALNLINKAVSLVKQKQYSELAVRYVDENNRHKTLGVSTREQNIREKVFAKSEKIVLEGSIINQCEEEIHEELFDKMRSYLTK